MRLLVYLWTHLQKDALLTEGPVLLLLFLSPGGVLKTSRWIHNQLRLEGILQHLRPCFPPKVDVQTLVVGQEVTYLRSEPRPRPESGLRTPIPLSSFPPAQTRPGSHQLASFLVQFVSLCFLPCFHFLAHPALRCLQPVSSSFTRIW